MPIVLKVSGTLCLLVGCIWLLQGVGILPGSFMTGDMKWAINGAILVVAGIVMLVVGRRKRA